jgi:phosphatidylglycerol lysyltransferase
MRSSLKRVLPPIAAALLFGLALVLLHHTLEEYHYRDVMSALQAIPHQRIAWAILLTLANYFILCGYDFLGMRYIGRTLARARVALASFVSYAFSQSLGFGVLTGGSLRFRLYSMWGLGGAEIAGVVAFCALTFWLGIFTVGGLVFILDPFTIPDFLGFPIRAVLPIGIIFLALTGSYIVLSAVSSGPIRIGRWEFSVPGWRMALMQIGLASVDWMLAGAVLFALLPPTPSLSYPGLLGIFILAQVAGLISHVPGGIGVFEALVSFALSGQIPGPTILGALLAYRVIYYLLPLSAASVTLAGVELAQTRWAPIWTRRVLGRWIPNLMPQVLAVATFVAGIILLVSGATPAVSERMHILMDVLPLPVIEISHLLGSLVGVMLLFLAWGVQRRLDVTYHLSIGFLAIGIMASLLKGLDYEEGILLFLALLAFLSSRRYFYRHSSLVAERFSPGWTSAIVVAIGGSIWVGIFSYKHVEYSHELWWQFSLLGDAPRFLRATLAVVSVASIFAVARLIRPARPPAGTLPSAGLETIRPIVAASTETVANLALLGDKSFLLNERKSAFIMYAVEGRTWVSMGDPIGPLEDREELVWQFVQLADRYAGWPVFYQTKPDNLHLYVDLGLTFQKLGEEARVELGRFAVDELKKTARHSYRKAVAEGCELEVVPASAVPALLPQLQAISDEWLKNKTAQEKSFSLGRFDSEYLSCFPMALIRQDSRLVAFANVWKSAENEELSIDLMRQTRHAPSGTMDFLFIALMLWGKEHGYRWFNLGMAPLSGLERRPLATLWNKMGSMIYQYGEQYYNFQGLRFYKEKFDPVWEPRYLASPGGLVLPRVLTNVASLISGSVKGVITK